MILFQELADLEPLVSLTKLEFISLLHNPVVTKRNYREYVIHKFPNLRSVLASHTDDVFVNFVFFTEFWISRR